MPAHKTTERYLTLLLEVEPFVRMFVSDKKEPAKILGSFLFLCEEKGLVVLVLVEMPNLEESGGVPLRPLTPRSSEKHPSCTTW